MVIPCDLTTDGVTGYEKIDYEWGFKPDGSDGYRTLLRQNDIKLHPEMPHDQRVHLHPTHTSQEDCSLVISPLLMEDSGTYEIHVIVDGARSGPSKKINVHVTDSPLMTAGSKFSRRRQAMVQLSQPMAVAVEEETAPVEEGQVRPVEEELTNGKNRKVRHPVNKVHAWCKDMLRLIKEAPIEKKQRRTGKGHNYGKKNKTRRKAWHRPRAHRPVSTTIQMTTAPEETGTVGKKTTASAETQVKELTFSRLLLKYACLLGMGTASAIVVSVMTFCIIGRKFRKRRQKQIAKLLEEGRMVQEEE
ncbi:uncharacterized protein LOC143926591 [Lithobates pipiens]